MNRFSSSLALFASLAYADDVTNCLTAPNASCALLDETFYGVASLPQFGNMVALGGQVNVRQVTTGDGYILSMARIPYPDEDDGVFKGPVLLAHGLGGAAWNWFLGDNTKGDQPLWKRLQDAGYEPWLLNNRGQVSSLGHTVTDLYTDDPELYWDFDSRELAYEDIPAFLEQIKSERDSEGRACKKTTIIGHSNGARIGVLAAGKPDDEGAHINKVVGLAPAYQRNPNYQDFTEGPCEDLSSFEVEDRGRFNRSRERYCKDQERSRSKGRSHSKGRHLRSKSSDTEACERAPLSRSCQRSRPFPQVFYQRVYDAQKELGYFSIFGPNRDQQLSEFCGVFGEQSYECGLFTRSNSAITSLGEIGFKLLDDLAQQVFTDQFDIFNDDFNTNGWFTDTPEHDLTGTTCPIVNILVENDGSVDNDAARRVARQYTTNGVTFYTITDGRSHAGIVGDNDDLLFDILTEVLGENDDDIC